ncbi:MAG: hypothetical protein KY469_01565 [Actinobacteria bacterium]|nr:hypothetical protein [Actinomycetota bacterium]
MRVWWLTPAGTPVVVLEAAGVAASVSDRVRDGGLGSVPAFYDHTPPRRPPRVGFALDAAELRLVDEHGDPIVRVPRENVDRTWLQTAVARKGTLTYVTPELDLDDEGGREVADAVDAAAREGSVLGGIVGVVEEHVRLPLTF